MVKPLAELLESGLNFGPLEKAARRPLDAEERETLQDVAMALLWKAVLLKWREWERLPHGSSRRWTERPPERLPPGSNKYRDFRQACIFLQRFLDIGKYSAGEKIVDGEKDIISRNVISGPFPEVVSELVNQIGPYAPEGAFPTNVGQFIQDVLPKKRRSTNWTDPSTNEGA